MILKKIPSDELCVRKFRILPVFFFNYLLDSNSNLRPARIDSEFFLAWVVELPDAARTGVLCTIQMM